MKKACRYTIILLFILLIIPGLFQGQESPPKAEEAFVGPKDPAEMGAFVDGIMRAHMKANHIAGATFSFVKDGEIFFAKGYGYADVEKRKPVKAAETMFRPGSVSKLFTWTAVMQLYEQGKLDLDADVNIYLEDFKIPDTYSKPITLKNLMTHTPGFEEMIKDMAVREPENLWTLQKYIATNMPARILPPGELTAYSNYGTGLAGYIVEKISGMPFEEYIEKNIFQPLNMGISTFRQPLPPNLKDYMSTGYTFKNGLFNAEIFELLNGMAPAGGLSSCATDMANFMIAHLQYGQFGENRILKEDTSKLMQTLLFTNHPKVNGNAYGFWEEKLNDLRTIGHGGDTIWFHSLLVLIPEKNEGFFVSYNSVGGGGSPRMHLMQALLDRYYPADKPEPKPLSDNRKRLEQCSGNYRPTRVVQTNWAKLMALMMNSTIKVTKEGNLLGAGRQWVEVEPYIFQEIAGQDKLVFEANDKGEVTNMFIDSVPYFAFVKVAWYESPLFSYALLAVCGILFLTTLRWPLGAIFRKICKCREEENAAPRIFRWFAGIFSILYLAFFIGIFISISDEMALLFGIPAQVKILLAFPLVSALLTLFALLFMMLAWAKKYWSWCARFHYTLVVLASIAMLWFLNFWNLLGYKL
ncbi:MAG: beta-lactamase family protein [Candidatus Aminicenantes bacterium]|nr:beta-lactamase family protein [Candidatus Aminicenantes bacterium]